MNLVELLKTAWKKPFTVYTATQFSFFLRANAARINFYQVEEWNGDTYVILKWPHKVSGLVVLP